MYRLRRRQGAGAGSRRALVLRPAQDVASRELELVLRGDCRRRVLLAGEIVLHVVSREKERGARVVVLGVAAHDDDGLRIATLGQIVPKLIRLLPCDVDNAEAPTLPGHVELE